MRAQGRARRCWRCGSRRAYDKDEILALYAAHAPFGGNVVGLEAAAWRYFGRDAGGAVLGGGRDARGAA